jgi:hypothetical protein
MSVHGFANCCDDDDDAPPSFSLLTIKINSILFQVYYVVCQKLQKLKNQLVSCNRDFIFYYDDSMKLI